MKYTFLFIGLLFFMCPAFAQDRNFRIVKVPTQNPTDQKRKAVVIGMSDYGGNNQLNNTINDADDMADVLTRLGFEVMLLKNNDMQNLDVNLANWYNSIAGNDMAVFYFSGHGIEVNGENYLIPVGFNNNDPKLDRNSPEPYLKWNTLNVNQVLDYMSIKGVEVKLLILDACRDNPFTISSSKSIGGEKKKGLARIDALNGTYIAFAAAPGTTADDGGQTYNLPNGVFTYFLKQEIIKKGATLDEIFGKVATDVKKLTHNKQNPFRNTDLGIIYIIPPSDDKPATDSPSELLRQADAFFGKKQYEEAFLLYEQAANTGNADAQNKLGTCYANGFSVEKNPNQAVNWYRKAAEQGLDVAQNSLGLCYETGYGVTKDINQAIEWYEKAAEQGNMNAQNALDRVTALNITDQIRQADAFFENKQYKDAIPLYEKAADAGNADAQNKLGDCYYNGYGVTKDMDRATGWYGKAAKQGNSNAQNALNRITAVNITESVRRADVFFENKQYQEAIPLYAQAANAGNADAQNKLGNCYANGRGVTKNYIQAVSLWKKAADQGDAKAQTNLGNCYFYGNGVSKDYKQAVAWYRKAAEQGDAKAQSNLGACYYNGWGVAKNDAQAVEWFRKAADQEDATAQTNLGVCCFNGRGVKQDYTQAVEWYKKAAEQGRANAQYNLATCYEDGFGTTQDSNQAAYWYRKAAEQGDPDAKKALTRLGVLSSQ